MTESKTRVLFVDDEPYVLQGLQRLLRPMRGEWEMQFVESGPRALEIMTERPCEVVISDMRMPGMNGAQLLLEVKQRYPKTVRLILSGHADKDLILKCVGTAHQFLAKPCDPEALRTAISRASAFENSRKSEKIKSLIAQMDCLPSIPTIFNEIIEKLQKEDTSVEEIGAIIAKDLAMTAKLLKLVNSAFFGLRRQVSSPGDAVTYLGLETIKSLVLAVNAFSSYEGVRHPSISFESLWSHSLQVAEWARQIALAESSDRMQTEESFIAGLLHDLGKLAFIANLPEDYDKALQFHEGEQLPLFQAEEAVFGANHADVGGYLLSLWGLPTGVVEGISFHHQPSQAGIDEFCPMVAVHAANYLARNKNDSGSTFAFSPLDEDFLNRAGFTAKMESWKSLIL
jgi:HD-like signal output (HDOD) protein/CheY-like chemotaxis protein